MSDLDDLMLCDCGQRHGLKECPALKTEPGTKRERKARTAQPSTPAPAACEDRN